MLRLDPYAFFDVVTIPDPNVSADPYNVDGWHQITDGTAWDISQNPDWQAEVMDGFFGGDAVLSVKIESSDGTEIMPQQDFNFRIAGENPDAAKCEAYINSVCTKYWYLYGIARQETSGEGSSSNYNHFLTRGGKYSNVPGREGIPNWNDDGTDGSYDSNGNPINRWTGTGGYGVLQLTYQAANSTSDTGDANYIMPRDWIWNWRNNVGPAIPKFQQKETISTKLYNWLVASFGPPSIQGQGCPTDGNNQDVFNSYDGILIGRYNGGNGFNPIVSPKDGSTMRSPWKLQNGQWIFTGTYTINVAGKL